jgi:hypothetical protein
MIVKPEIITAGGERYVLVHAVLAELLRADLLRRGIPCAISEPYDSYLQSIRLGQTANLGQVQAFLDSWSVPLPGRSARSPARGTGPAPLPRPSIG